MSMYSAHIMYLCRCVCVCDNVCVSDAYYFFKNAGGLRLRSNIITEVVMLSTMSRNVHSACVGIV